MTRDYSAFLPPRTTGGGPRRQLPFLETLGWHPHFAQQVSIDDLTDTPPVRIVAEHRGALQIAGEITGEWIDQTIPPLDDATVGDWVLLNRDHPQSSRVLARKSLIKRRAPGTGRQVQLIAANIDTAFIVSSCNQDFNRARLERYIALAFEAEITPVIVLTKADLTDRSQRYADEAQTISATVSVVMLDARGDEPATKLADWCRPGQTVAFLGSSGVGKSTLTNALSGTSMIATQAIRDDDAKGRHTTTRRQLHRMPSGCVVLDTPGMRELQLTDAAAGIDDVFADLRHLSTQCRFNDCQHMTEPGCAILAAIDRGEVDPARLGRWRKLMAEDAFNSASLAERRTRDKSFGKMVREIKKHKARGGWDHD